MYGFPADLDLDFLAAKELTLVSFDQYSLYLTLTTVVPGGTGASSGSGIDDWKHLAANPDAQLQLSGGWCLRDDEGKLLDERTEHGKREVFRLHPLLGCAVDRCELISSTQCDIVFSAGFRLSIFDDSKEYETFTIYCGDFSLIV